MLSKAFGSKNRELQIQPELEGLVNQWLKLGLTRETNKQKQLKVPVHLMSKLLTADSLLILNVKLQL